GHDGARRPLLWNPRRRSDHLRRGRRRVRHGIEEWPQDLPRRRHQRLRRHENHPRAVRARHLHFADRRPLHHVAARGRLRLPPAARQYRDPHALRDLPATDRHPRPVAEARPERGSRRDEARSHAQLTFHPSTVATAFAGGTMATQPIDDNASWRHHNFVTHGPVDDSLSALLPPRDEVLAEIEAEATRRKIPIVGPAVARFFQQLVMITGAKTVFEMGSAVGYSTIWWARAVGDGGKVHYTDSDTKNAAPA